MAADVLERLIVLNLVAGVAILALLAVGPALSRGFGARLAYVSVSRRRKPAR